MGGAISIVFDSSKDVGVHRRVNSRIMQHFPLIWLDKNIDDNNQDCCDTITQLCRVVNTIHTFTDDKKCIEFIKSITDKNVCMIISGALGQTIMPRIHSMSHVNSIFIFCGNKQRHEQWAKNWFKIKGVFTQISPICEALRKASQQIEENAISISFVTTSGNPANKNLNRLDPTFIYTQILKEILLTIKFDQQHITEFIDHCCKVFGGNEQELENADELKEKKYHDETPIWWYTYESFLYHMLNSALRTMDADILIKMGFFISDLHRQIEKLHKEQFSGHHARKTFTVFRGQGLSKAYFDQLLKTKGNLMCFNNFLSTSKNFDVTLHFANSNLADPNSVGILFVMTIDPSISTTPFASINSVSCFPAEAEVLFSMHTIFRIDDIKVRDEHGRLFQVNLTLISNDDKDVHNLTDCIRAETYPHLNGWYRLGQLLLKMGQSDKAQQVYEALLEHETDESLRETIYHEIGRAKDNQGQYKDAIKFYEKSLQIKEKTLSSNHLRLTHTYSNIGVAYYNLGDYSKAISYYEKALEIQQQSLPPDHSDLALSYNNIGNAYYNIGLYSKVLSFHEKALEIKRKTLPSNHPDLAKSYNNIGIVYRKMGEYSTTLLLYKKALEIREQSLPPNHPDLAASHNNIGLVYLDMNEHLNALWSHERAVEIREQSLHPNHPDLAKSYSNLGSVYEAMNDCKEAVSFYKRAVTIGQRSLPPDHPNLQQWQKELEDVEKKL